MIGMLGYSSMYLVLDFSLLTELYIFAYGIDWVDFLVINWMLLAVTATLTCKPNAQNTQTLLYLFGLYRTIIASGVGVVGLVYHNISAGFHFILYNSIDLFRFRPSSQIWAPLFRRGGYLTLVNASRSRWQLVKSHNLFKNK